MRRLSFLERQALALIQHERELSYETIADRLNCERSSACIVMKRLERRRRVVKIAGKGRQPNRYIPTDSLLQW